MRLPAVRGFVFAPIAAAIIEGVAKFDIGAYAFALIVAYPLTVVLGIPAYLLLRRRRMVRLWQVTALGCALGTLSGLILTLGSAGVASRVMRVVLFGLEGSATAATFWLIALCREKIGGAIQIGLVVCLLIGFAGYLAWWTHLARFSWVWTPAAIVCAMTAAAVLIRPAIARLLVYVLSALYVGYWLVLGVPRFIAGFHTEPWLVSALQFVPGMGLVVLPAAYCCLIATTYMPRRSSGLPQSGGHASTG
jgi:hypothetical protein